MRAIKNRIDVTASGLYGAQHFFVDGIERIHVKQTPPNTGLISRHDNAISFMGELGNRFHTAGDGFPFFRRLDVVIRISVDNAVTV